MKEFWKMTDINIEGNKLEDEIIVKIVCSLLPDVKSINFWKTGMGPKSI